MIEKVTLQETLFEYHSILKRMEKAATVGPEGYLWYRRYPDGNRVPYCVTGHGKSRKYVRLDPADRIRIESLKLKTAAIAAIPKVKANIRSLEKAKNYQDISLYSIFSSLGPGFESCADTFLGRKDKRVPNPAFDNLLERQNPYPFGPGSVPTEDGLFRSKSEVQEKEHMNRIGVEWKYEPALMLGSKTIYPDFAVNRWWRFDIGYIEHLGLMDSIDYRDKKLEDIRTLWDHGYLPGVHLLIISENKREGFDYSLAKKMINAFCLP